MDPKGKGERPESIGGTAEGCYQLRARPGNKAPDSLYYKATAGWYQRPPPQDLLTI